MLSLNSGATSCPCSKPSQSAVKVLEVTVGDWAVLDTIASDARLQMLRWQNHALLFASWVGIGEAISSALTLGFLTSPISKQWLRPKGSIKQKLLPDLPSFGNVITMALSPDSHTYALSQIAKSRWVSPSDCSQSLRSCLCLCVYKQACKLTRMHNEYTWTFFWNSYWNTDTKCFCPHSVSRWEKPIGSPETNTAETCQPPWIAMLGKCFRNVGALSLGMAPKSGNGPKFCHTRAFSLSFLSVLHLLN